MTNTEIPQTNPNQLNIKVNVKEHSKITKSLGLLGLIGAGALILSQCNGNFIEPKNSISIQKAEVFKVVPEEINCRALEKAKIRVAVSKTFKTPLDHVPVIGAIIGAVERSSRATSVFTGSDGEGEGVVDTLVCFNSASVKVDSEHNGRENIIIPSSSVVTFSAINEARSSVIREDGNLSNLGQFEWDLIGGSAERTVATGRAALDSLARAVAIDEATTTCTKAAWSDVGKAAQDAYRIIARQEYDQAKDNGAKLTKFNANNIFVTIKGQDPNIQPPYNIPNGVTITGNGNNSPAICTVAHNAFQNVPYVNALNQAIPSSLNANT